MIRTALRGLRGRLLLAFVATSAVTLIVAAAITLGPLQSRLRDESETRAARDDRGRCDPEFADAAGQVPPEEHRQAGPELRAATALSAACRRCERAHRRRPSSCASAPAARACSSPTSASPTARARSPAFLYDTDFQNASEESAMRLAIQASIENAAETQIIDDELMFAMPVYADNDVRGHRRRAAQPDRGRDDRPARAQRAVHRRRHQPRGRDRARPRALRHAHAPAQAPAARRAADHPGGPGGAVARPTRAATRSATSPARSSACRRSCAARRPRGARSWPPPRTSCARR